MTDRLNRLKEYQWEKRHHAFRKAETVDPEAYRQAGLTDCERTARRFQTALALEDAVLLPDERIIMTRTVPALPMIYTDAEWAGIRAAHYIHESGYVSNLSPDYGRVIGEGLLAARERLGGGAYHRAMRKSIDAVLSLVGRYGDAARAQGREDIAALLSRVPAKGATSFHEALQSLRIVHFAMWCEGNYHNTLGRFDQYMWPYLEADLAAGRLTEEAAQELLEEFFLTCNRDSDLYPGMQQGDNGQSMVLGGMTPDGADGYNPLSAMCLRASASLRLIDPKINLRVHRDTPLSVYRLGTELTRRGLGFPQYENDDVAIKGLMALGYDERDARNYAMAACWEFIIPGRGMEIPNIGAVSFAKVVDTAIRRALPFATGMEAVEAEVQAQLTGTVQEIAASVRNLYILPSPFMSLFFDGCVENQRDISLGCVYNNYGLHGTGIAPAADALAAVATAVFEQGVGPETLLAAMDANYIGYEPLRHQLQTQCPKMGNDDDRVDAWASRLVAMFSDAVAPLRNERGGRFRAGTGSAMYYVWHASELGATADGRTCGTPLPANYAPSLHVRLDGPTSLIRSFTKPPLARAINGGPLTIEFHDTVFRNAQAIDKVAQLVRMFVRLGGHQLQLNTVNREQLLDAQQNPDRYRNLIVRVWGWSGYFVELDRCYQDQIIQRVALGVD